MGLEAAGIHGLPEALHGGRERCGIAHQLFEQVGHQLYGEQAHILGEHGEEAPHEEFGDVAGVVLALKALGDDRETTGNVAGDFGGFFRRVEAQRIGPDGFQPRLNGGIAQVLHGDAKTLGIGKLRIILSLAGKVGIELDDMADIDKDDEGRIAVFDRQMAGVVDRL